MRMLQTSYAFTPYMPGGATQKRLASLMSETARTFLLPYLKLSTFVFLLEISEILLCSLLTLHT